MVLEEVKKYIHEKLIDEDTSAVLLIGSWATGNYSDPFDIDIMLIKKAQLSEMYRMDVPTDNFQLDVYVYDHNSLYNDLNGEQDSLNHINNISLALLGLCTAEVLYDHDQTINQLIELAKNWNWNSSSENYLNFEVNLSEIEWIKNAMNEDIRALELAKERFKSGKAITTRKKDYPELLIDVDEEKSRNLMALVEKAYASLGLTIQWSELNDARKSLANSEWNKAFASMKDVLRYMLRYALPSVPEQILDPNLWNSTSINNISEELKIALKTAFKY